MIQNRGSGGTPAMTLSTELDGVAGTAAVPPLAPGAVTTISLPLDPARFAQVTGIDVLPVVSAEDAADAPGDGVVRNWPPPDLGAARNYRYMLQWIAFAVVALALWTWFVVLRK